MGNCLNQPSSAATAIENQNNLTLTPKSATLNTSDAPTIESNSVVTDQSLTSPPSSPGKDAPSPRNNDCISPLTQESSEGESQNLIINKSESPCSTTQSNNFHQLENNGSNTRDDMKSCIQKQREEGQRLLRELVTSTDEAEELDWKSIIALASELHRKEQRLLKSYNEQRLRKNTTNGNGSTILNKNLRQRSFFEKRRKRKEIIRRRKLESVGSFSVNLLLYNADDVSDDKDCGKDAGNTNLPMQKARTGHSSHEDLINLRAELDEKGRHQSESETIGSRPGTPLPFTQAIKSSDDAKCEANTKPNASSTINPKVAIEGSFLAACSVRSPHKSDDNSSNSSSSSTTSNMTFGRSWDDGLITIDENASVKMW